MDKYNVPKITSLVSEIEFILRLNAHFKCNFILWFSHPVLCTYYARDLDVR